MKLSDGTEWVLVPRVTTEEMHRSMLTLFRRGLTDILELLPGVIWGGTSHGDTIDDFARRNVIVAHAAMLAAAPQPPVEEMVEDIVRIIYETRGWVPANVAKIHASDCETIARAIVKLLMGKE